jgi:hypothetical protein
MTTQTQTINPQMYDIVADELIGLVRSQAIRLAAQLRLADLVKDGPKTVNELSKQTGTDRHALYKLLYALACCGYFEEVAPETFAQSERSAVLRTDIPRSMHDFALMHGGFDWQWLPWRKAEESIRTGKPVFPELFGEPLFSYFRNHPEIGAAFQKAMSSQSAQYEQAIARGYNFSAATTIVDVGGGQGGLLATILRAYPTPRGVLFDQPAVIDMARRSPFLQGLEDRVELVSGNFFEAVPAGAPLYIMKQIIHDWDDEQCIQILAHCRQVMQPGGRVLVIDEMITPGKKVPPQGALIDLQLQLLLPGRKRSEAEHHLLFEEAGLRLNRMVPTESTYTILEAVAS